MATTDRLLFISDDGLVRQLGFDPSAADWAGGGSSTLTIADTPPALPHANLFWWNSLTGMLHVQYSDAWISALNVRNGVDGATGAAGTDGTNGADGVASLSQLHAALLSF